MAETVEISAQRIAERGREALLERLRSAFEEAAAAHADVLELDDDKLAAMIERAAERADGLQWRRVLAAVATEELGIGLGEALAHPAVARAQAIVGAPSYEDGLAAIAEGKVPDPGASERDEPAPAAAAAAAAAAPGAATGEADADKKTARAVPAREKTGGEAPRREKTAGEAPAGEKRARRAPAGEKRAREAAAPPRRTPRGKKPAASKNRAEGQNARKSPRGGREDKPAGAEAQAPESAQAKREAGAGTPDPEGLPVSVEVVHVDGLPVLEGQGELALRFSAEGLDIMRTFDGAVLAGYTWSEVGGVEVTPGRGRILRRRSARVVVTTTRHRGRFEARGSDASELRERLGPALARIGAEG